MKHIIMIEEKKCRICRKRLKVGLKAYSSNSRRNHFCNSCYKKHILNEGQTKI